MKHLILFLLTTTSYINTEAQKYKIECKLNIKLEHNKPIPVSYTIYSKNLKIARTPEISLLALPNRFAFTIECDKYADDERIEIKVNTQDYLPRNIPNNLISHMNATTKTMMLPYHSNRNADDDLNIYVSQLQKDDENNYWYPNEITKGIFTINFYEESGSLKDEKWMKKIIKTTGMTVYNSVLFPVIQKNTYKGKRDKFNTLMLAGNIKNYNNEIDSALELYSLLNDSGFVNTLDANLQTGYYRDSYDNLMKYTGFNPLLPVPEKKNFDTAFASRIAASEYLLAIWNEHFANFTNSKLAERFSIPFEIKEPARTPDLIRKQINCYQVALDRIPFIGLKKTEYLNF